MFMQRLREAGVWRDKFPIFAPVGSLSETTARVPRARSLFGQSKAKLNLRNRLPVESTVHSRGSDVADFLIGLPNQSTINTARPDTNGLSWHYGVFAQDSFRATPK